MNSTKKGGDFASLRQLLLEDFWGDPVQTSAVLCQMLEESLPQWDGDDDKLYSRRTVGVETLFFAFTGYFAAALTVKRLAGVSGASSNVVDHDDGGVDNDLYETSRVQGVQLPSALMQQWFPPLHELWRQPSLIAAIEQLGETVWGIQVVLHSGGNGEHNSVGCCPLCYAASLEHVIGTNALWSLLEFHAVHRVEVMKGSPFENTNNVDASIVAANVASSVHTKGGHVLELDAATQNLLWMHANAVCRNAIWNGAIQTTRLCIEQWLYGGKHDVLFATSQQHLPKERVAVQVGGYLRSFRSFLLSQCCLLVQDEVAFEKYATADRCIDDNAEHLSSASLLSLKGRGDAELYASLLAMWGAASVFEDRGGRSVFAALTMTTPHHATGGVPLLHWVCEKGYEACARLLLTTWVAVYRDNRLPTETGKTQNHTERRLRIDFMNSCEAGVLVEAKKAPRTAIATAIRCTALYACRDVLPYAVRGESASIVRQLFLFGASGHRFFHNSSGGVAGQSEIQVLLRDPSSILDPFCSSSSSSSLHERVRSTLCAAAAADMLANAASRLWNEKVRSLSIGKNNEGGLLYRRSHDSVMRTTLAALEFDPHNTVARTTLRDVLARKVVDSRTLGSMTGETSIQERKYNTAVCRMCEQLTRAPTECEEIRSLLLQTAPHNVSSPLFFTDTVGGKCGVSGEEGSAATVATDEQQKPVYVLVNLFEAVETTAAPAMMHPLWVRLPRGVNLPKSLELAGGMYGVVESVVPLVAPVERGDLVIFALRRKFRRFDVTRVVRPRDGIVVEVPCVLQGSGTEMLTRCVLRCAMVPTPVYEFDDDRIANDPLQWLEAAGPGVNDVVEQILCSRSHLQRWSHISHLGCRPMWFRDIHVNLFDASIWRLDLHPCGGKGEAKTDGDRVVLAAAAFPFLCDTDAEDADDPFGASSDSVFILQQHGEEWARETAAACSVVGILPAWGWS